MKYLKQQVTEAELMAAGWVDVKSLIVGEAVAFVSPEFPNGYRHTELDAMKGRRLNDNAATTTPHLEQVRAALSKYLCTVDGKPVAELAVLIKPVAFLVTTDNGTHEIGRCYFQGDKFTVGPDLRRIGGIGIDSVEYFPERGLYLHLEKDYELFVPSSHCQATWKRLPA